MGPWATAQCAHALRWHWSAAFNNATENIQFITVKVDPRYNVSLIFFSEK